MSDRTWMKVWGGPGDTFYVGIERDTIVACKDSGGSDMGLVIGLRADDTLSQWAHDGWEIERVDGSPE